LTPAAAAAADDDDPPASPSSLSSSLSSLLLEQQLLPHCDPDLYNSNNSVFFQRVSLAIERYNSVAFKGTFTVPTELD